MTLKRTLSAAIVLVVVTVGLMLIGLEPLFALAGGLLAGAAVLLGALRRAPSHTDDGLYLDRAPLETGSEVSRLAWGFNMRTGVAGVALTRRARAVLKRRLATIGIDPEDPAQLGRVDEILGAGTWQLMTASRAQRDDIDRALDATEHLTEPKERQ